MVGDNHQPAAFLEACSCAFQKLFQGAHFLVDLYPKGLVDACKGLVLCVLGKSLCNCAVQVSGGPDAVCGLDEPCNLTGVVHLSVQPQDTLQVLFRICVHHVCSSDLGFLVHPHVQRSVLEAEAESAFRRVKLVARYPQIRQNAVEGYPMVARVVLNKPEVVVDQSEPRVLGRIVYSVDVTIEGDDAPAIV